MASYNTRMLKMITIGIPSSFMYLKMFIIILASIATTRINAVDSDIRCLRSMKESLQDPLHRLSNWNFENMTEGFICRFTGVECWSPDENKVLNLNLSKMGLRGSFPIGLRNCGSMVGLDLSRNHLSGHIPNNLPDVLRFVTSLDLSNNNLSGPIPPSIANCSFISVLNLDNNHLTGQIPPQLSLLGRIKEFSVANNKLSGCVPLFRNGNISAKSYANNLGLCGGPLNACEREDHDDLFLKGFAVGFPLYTILTMLFMFYWSPRPSIGKMLSYLHLINKKEGISQTLVEYESSNDSDQGNAKSSLSLSFTCNYMFNTRVISMEKVIQRLSLQEVERATNDFDGKNVIGYGNMGVMYKATFINNLQLAVKRLHKFESLDKEFLTEIEILGRLRQTNLVPLLGFCFEIRKKFLVYEYMCNGNLHEWLHCMEGRKMGWGLRFKIAIGIARGLSWLHHNKVLRVAHLKINSRCILLDENFEPKISNFGDAMILMNASGASPSSGCNFVVEDCSYYKADVYSFGILLLELVTGREPSTWMKSPSDRAIDESLMGQGFNEEIHETVRIAENCIRLQIDDATSMLQVYQEMRLIRISRNENPVHTKEHDQLM